MTPLDVVYIVKAGESNEELRHSLRSLANMPVRQVWMVGYRPKWVKETVGYIPVIQRGQKNQNTWHNWRAMAASPELPDRFVLMNDDFYIMRPVTAIPAYHRGNLDVMIDWYAQQRLNSWRSRAVSTRALLRAVHPDVELFSYELHLPLMIDRAAMAEALNHLAHARRAPAEHYNKRTWYGNYAQIGGWKADDVKAMGGKAGMPTTDLPFLSTSPHSWPGLVGGTIRRIFAEMSPYERTPSSGLYRPSTLASRRLTRAGQ
jgi:hypothetical protein